jgi:type II secretory pathway pseudopilin PulG
MNAIRQSGFTLIELLLYVALSLVVLVVAGGILISGLRTQETARSVTDAANTAQQIVRSVQYGVRNASAISIARTVGSDPDSTAPSCQAWYYDPTNGGSVYTTKTTPAALITVPSGGPQGIWTFLGKGVSPSDPVTGKVFNAPSGGRVELRFDVAAGAHPYVLVNTMTYTPQAATVSAPCF